MEKSSTQVGADLGFLTSLLNLAAALETAETQENGASSQQLALEVRKPVRRERPADESERIG